MKNPIGLKGIDFVEFVSPNPDALENLFYDFGFSKLRKHQELQVETFHQNDIHFFLNKNPNGFAETFGKLHGPSISSMGWRVESAEKALKMALSRGAQRAQARDYLSWPAIYGIGESLIYFVEEGTNPLRYENAGFQKLQEPVAVKEMGFLKIDHLTNNVTKGSMQKWAQFYKSIFGFEEVRYFDIRGAKTGLTSYALKSPCGNFCIPINEATESKSQINEYLQEYNGPGIQHLAFLTENILESLDHLKNSKIQMLDIDEEYYKTIFEKFPQVSEDHSQIRNHNVLVDGDDEGYLLQIFTKNIIGPIFIEIIQRRNHNSFGEGNFGALFRSIERDQMKRGYLS